MSAAPSTSLASELHTLAQLRATGALTEDEFRTAKSRILSRQSDGRGVEAAEEGTSVKTTVTAATPFSAPTAASSAAVPVLGYVTDSSNMRRPSHWPQFSDPSAHESPFTEQMRSLPSSGALLPRLMARGCCCAAVDVAWEETTAGRHEAHETACLPNPYAPMCAPQTYVFDKSTREYEIKFTQFVYCIPLRIAHSRGSFDNLDLHIDENRRWVSVLLSEREVGTVTDGCCGSCTRSAFEWGAFDTCPCCCASSDTRFHLWSTGERTATALRVLAEWQTFLHGPELLAVGSSLSPAPAGSMM